MLNTIHRSDLLSRIQAAYDVPEGFTALRQFIFDYYYADNDYDMSDDPVLDQVFGQLSAYLEYEEVYRDALRSIHMQDLYKLLVPNFSLEAAIAALHWEKIKELTRSWDAHKISETVYQEQLSLLSPVPYSIEKMLLMVILLDNQKS